MFHAAEKMIVHFFGIANGPYTHLNVEKNTIIFRASSGGAWFGKYHIGYYFT